MAGLVYWTTAGYLAPCPCPVRALAANCSTGCSTGQNLQIYGFGNLLMVLRLSFFIHSGCILPTSPISILNDARNSNAKVGTKHAGTDFIR
jgi:hypothetical protein